MFRHKLRTLLIVLALGPPVLAVAWFAWSHLIATSPQARLKQELQAKQNAETAKLAASQNARRLELQRLKLELVEKENKIADIKSQMENKIAKIKSQMLYELSRSNLMEAEPGIYFLGPELLPPAELH